MEAQAIERAFVAPNRSFMIWAHIRRAPELGDFLEEIAPGGEEEAEAVGEVVDLQSSAQGSLDVGDAVGQGEGSSWTAVAPASRMW